MMRCELFALSVLSRNRNAYQFDIMRKRGDLLEHLGEGGGGAGWGLGWMRSACFVVAAARILAWFDLGVEQSSRVGWYQQWV